MTPPTQTAAPATPPWWATATRACMQRHALSHPPRTTRWRPVPLKPLGSDCASVTHCIKAVAHVCKPVHTSQRLRVLTLKRQRPQSALQSTVPACIPGQRHFNTDHVAWESSIVCVQQPTGRVLNSRSPTNHSKSVARHSESTPDVLPRHASHRQAPLS